MAQQPGSAIVVLNMRARRSSSEAPDQEIISETFLNKSWAWLRSQFRLSAIFVFYPSFSSMPCDRADSFIVTDVVNLVGCPLNRLEG